MLNITFYSESNLKDFRGAVKQFEEIWSELGIEITKKWEEVTGLKFVETEITALVADFKSRSHPLTLRYNNDDHMKKVTLVHELGHRILFRREGKIGMTSTLESHQLLFLVLYDVLDELFGRNFLEKAIAWDSELGKKNGESAYEEAWKWAIEHETKTKRQAKFKYLMSGGKIS